MRLFALTLTLCGALADSVISTSVGDELASNYKVGIFCHVNFFDCFFSANLTELQTTIVIGCRSFFESSKTVAPGRS